MLHTRTATSEPVKYVFSIMGIVGRCLNSTAQSDGMGAEQWKCAKHELHTITATSENVECVFGIMGIAGRFRNSTAEWCRRVLSSEKAPYTCYTRPPQRPSMSNACLALWGPLGVVEIRRHSPTEGCRAVNVRLTRVAHDHPND